MTDSFGSYIVDANGKRVILDDADITLLQLIVSAVNAKGPH